MEPHNTCKIGAKIGLGASIGKDAGSPEFCIAKLDPFGDETNAGPRYKPMALWQAGTIVIAETISLGVLGLPKILSTLGLVPAIVIMLAVGIISSRKGYSLDPLRHYQISRMADAGDHLKGQLGRWLLGIAQLGFYVFVMASHVLTFSIMMNVLTDRGGCTLMYSAVGLLVSFVVTLLRQLSKLSHLSHLSSASFVSIVMATLVTLISEVISQSMSGHKLVVSPAPVLQEACLVAAHTVFAYAGHVALFTLFSELQDYQDVPRALILLQISEMILYTSTAIVIHAYVGPSLTSPALISAETLFHYISYGIAIPTLVIRGIVSAYVAVKSNHARMFRGTAVMHAQSSVTQVIWAAICILVWTFSCIMEAIPLLKDALSLASSLLARWFSFGPPGMLWLYINRHRWILNRNEVMYFCIHIGLVVFGVVVSLSGIYSSLRSIYHSLSERVTGNPSSPIDSSL